MASTPFILETYHSKFMSGATGKGPGYFWRLRSRRNKKIIADGSEAYASKGNLNKALRRIPINWTKVERIDL